MIIIGEGEETAERIRARLRQEELKRNPTGNMNDAFNRGSTGNLAGLGWKGTGILILVLIIGFIIASIILK